MELQNSNAIGRFIMTLFIFLCLLALSPMLFSGIQFMKTQQLCSIDYTFLCFVGDAMLPVILLVILSMLIGYLKGRN